jgi:hypothetical protein
MTQSRAGQHKSELFYMATESSRSGERSLTDDKCSTATTDSDEPCRQLTSPLMKNRTVDDYFIRRRLLKLIARFFHNRDHQQELTSRSRDVIRYTTIINHYYSAANTLNDSSELCADKRCLNLNGV